MFGAFRLLSWNLDLDAAWVTDQEFETVMDGDEILEQYRCKGLPWDICLAWFGPLLKHGLDSGASAFHLLRDPKGNCLRQLIYIPSSSSEGQREWFELVPMPWPLLDRGIRAVRMIAFMMPWSRRGVIRYRYKGKWAKARCIQETVNDLVIYLTEDRPALRRLPQKPLPSV